MSARIIGFQERPVFGIQALKPILNPPQGKIRVKMRANCFAKVFVKNNETTRHFYLIEAEDARMWKLAYEHGANITVRAEP